VGLGDIATWVGAVGTLATGIVAIAAWRAGRAAAVAAWEVVMIERRRDEGRQMEADRAQANLISAWQVPVLSDSGDPHSPLQWGFAIRNLSQQPVYQFRSTYVPMRDGAGQMNVIHELVPPGDWRLSGSELYPYREIAVPNSAYDDLPDAPHFVEIEFTDTSGRRWSRDRQGVLTRVEQPTRR
jgi:hypothetical protein